MVCLCILYICSHSTGAACKAITLTVIKVGDAEKGSIK